MEPKKKCFILIPAILILLLKKNKYYAADEAIFIVSNNDCNYKIKESNKADDTKSNMIDSKTH